MSFSGNVPTATSMKLKFPEFVPRVDMFVSALGDAPLPAPLPSATSGV